MTSELLTSAEVADLLGVAPATVKRWADAGVLPCEKTAGHHRRFVREDVERFRERQASGGAGPAEAWVDLLTSNASVYDVHAKILSARARLGSFHAVATHLTPVLVEIGRRWRSGELSIVGEHAASQVLARALARCAEAIPVPPDARRVLLAAAEEEEHTLGLALVEVVAREAGATTIWAGEPTPAKELVAALRSGSAEILAVSAGKSRDPARLAMQAGRLIAASRLHGSRIVFGGAGPWPDIEAPHVRLEDFHDLYEWLRTP